MKLVYPRILACACSALMVLVPAADAQAVLLNEIYPNPPGNTLPHEFVEIKGVPLQSLNNYILLAVNANAGVAGRADLVLNLSGTQIGANGLLVVKASVTNGFIVPAATTVIEDARFMDNALSPLNNNSLSVLLVQSAVAPVEGVDYDTDDDGLFDVAPLDTATVVDSISIRQLAGDPVYGGARVPNVGNDGRPEALARLFGDARARVADAWFAGRMNGSGLTIDFDSRVTPNFPAGATLTPGRENLVLNAFAITASAGTTDVDEDGVTDTYTLALGGGPPTGAVTVDIIGNEQVQVSLDGVSFSSQAMVRFTSENSSQLQTITVRAVDDELPEAGRTHTGVVTHRIGTSEDTENYPTTLRPAEVPVNIFDNDSRFPIVMPTLETPAGFLPDNFDDPAVWIHPTAVARSLLLTTRKLGGAAIFDFNLNWIQSLVPETNGALRLNNVDVLYGFPLQDGEVDLAVFSDRVADTLYIYRLDADSTTNVLTLVSADLNAPIFPGSIGGDDTAYGLCLYRSPLSGRHYAFVSREGLSTVAQLELFDAGGGQVGWRRVRTIALPDARQVEGMVADQELGWLYLAQEKVGLWKSPAEPSRANDGSTLIQSVKPVGDILAADVEGVCLYYASNGTGYLIASSQGENSFSVFAREGTNSWLGNFVVGANRPLGIDQVTTSDGGDVCAFALPGFPQGVLIVHDGENDGLVTTRNTNFKLVPWEKIAGALSPPLAIAPSAFDPRAPMNRLPARFDSITRDADGTVHLGFSGGTGLGYRLEVSENLAQWDTVTDVLLDSASERHSFVPTSSGQTFYRLVSR